MQLRKRIACIFMAICLALNIFPVTVFAVTSGTVSGTVTYTINGSTLTISGTGAIPDNITAGFQTATGVKTINIQEGITAVGANIFGSMPDVTVINLPNTLTSFQKGNIPATVTSFHIPKNLTILDDTVFNEATSLASITVDSANTKFIVVNNVLYYKNSATDWAARGCPHIGVTEIKLHDNCSTVINNAFRNSTSLITIDFNKTTYIGEAAFYDCSNLQNITIRRDIMIAIRPKAFFNCPKLKQHYYSSKSDGNSYNYCSNVETVYVEISTNNRFCSGNYTSLKDIYTSNTESLPSNVLYNNPTIHMYKANVGLYNSLSYASKSKVQYIDYPLSGTNVLGTNCNYEYDLTTRTLTISGTGELPRGNRSTVFTAINPITLYSSFAEKIVIEEGITAITPFSIHFTPYCTDVRFPNSLKRVDSGTFYSGSYTSIHIPKSLEKMEGFGYITTIAGFTIDEGNTNFTVVDGILYKLTNGVITSLVRYPPAKSYVDTYTMPSTVTSLGSYATCSIKVKNVIVSPLVTSISRDNFNNSSYLQEVDFSSCTKLKTIDNMFVSNSRNIKVVDLSNTIVNSIGQSFCYNSASDLTVKLPTTFTGSRDFNSLNNIKSGLIYDYGGSRLIEYFVPKRTSYVNLKYYLPSDCTKITYAKNSGFPVNCLSDGYLNYRYGTVAAYYCPTTKQLDICGTGSFDISSCLNNMSITVANISKIVVWPHITGITGLTTSWKNIQTVVYGADLQTNISSYFSKVFGYAGTQLQTYCNNNSNCTFIPLQACGDNVYWYQDIDNSSIVRVVGEGTMYSTYTAMTVPWKSISGVTKLYYESTVKLNTVCLGTLRYFCLSPKMVLQSNTYNNSTKVGTLKIHYSGDKSTLPAIAYSNSVSGGTNAIVVGSNNEGYDITLYYKPTNRNSQLSITQSAGALSSACSLTVTPTMYNPKYKGSKTLIAEYKDTLNSVSIPMYMENGTTLLSGTWTPATAMAVGANQAVTGMFTPDDLTYKIISVSFTITVNKGTLTVKSAPKGTSINYGQAISSSTLSGGSVTNKQSEIVSGGWQWKNTSEYPSAGTTQCIAKFIPADKTNYNY